MTMITLMSYRCASIICMILFYQSYVFTMPSSMRCQDPHGCLNGGTLIMPRSIFGYCRCICPGNYGGPVCELTRYRSMKIKKLVRIKDTLENILKKRMEQS